jgi:predicted nucleotidyltransferase
MVSWETERVDELGEAVRREIIDILRDAGAVFAFIHGSTVRGTAQADSDIDVAAWWASDAPPSFEVLLPPRVDLLVLNGAPLELAGRVAVEGVLLFDDDPAARVHWVAQTRKIYFDELPRIERSHREFLESLRRGR